MSVKVIVGEKEFEVKFDKDYLVAKAKTLEMFEEGVFTGFEEDEETPLTKEEFEENVEDFVSVIESVCTEEYAKKIVHRMPKKKNGTFYKGRKDVVAYYGNTHFFTEWHNTWGTYELRFSSVSDLVVELQIVSYNHTPA